MKLLIVLFVVVFPKYASGGRYSGEKPSTAAVSSVGIFMLKLVSIILDFEARVGKVL